MISRIWHKMRSIPSWIFWTVQFFIVLIIVIFNDVFGEEDGFVVFGLFYFTFLAFASLRWFFMQIRSVISLKRDKAKMEMLHLKSQVNPHFFFNTLNNLYGLVEKDPKEAQSLILKLSDLMRYSIYEGQNEWVSLEEEVIYLKNYVELHKNRYHKNVTVDFKTNIDQEGYQIMPLMLILLVENAFKHGVEKLRNDTFVNIELNADDGKIEFIISNNYDKEEMDNTSTGIGLSNLKRRLEIGYHKRFELHLEDHSEIFRVQLTLQRV